MHPISFAESMTGPDLLSAVDEGQLSLDVFRRGNDMVIRSTVSGVKSEDLDISVNGDLLTIRGKREADCEIPEDDWYYRECYWGAFSRSIVLPYEVASDLAEASIKNGVLEIRMPIREHGKKVRVREE